MTIQDNPLMQLALMSRGYVVSRAIQTITQLNIPEMLSNTPMPVEIIAKKTHLHVEPLFRLLRFLSAYGIFKRDGRSFSLTKLSEYLQPQHPQSFYPVLSMVDASWWESFGQLDKCLTHGEAAFEYKHHHAFFDYLSEHPEQQAHFDEGMAQLSTFDDPVIAKTYPFDEHTSISDLGGGRGGLLRAIHDVYPHIPLTLFDTPYVLKQLSPSDFPKEISFQEGNFFQSIPETDALMFKGVLHDFPDDKMKEILANCKKNMKPQQSLIIIEQVMPEEDIPHPNKTMDIVMMTLLAGRQRTLQEWSELLESSGFIMKNVYPTESLFTLMVFQLA